MKQTKKIKNGVGDLRLIAAVATILGIIVLVLNTWNCIRVSIDTYVENKNGNVVEYTKNFIETKNDKDINREDKEYIKTKKDANMYMTSYISDVFLSIIITAIGTIGFWRLTNFYNKENLDNPFDENVINNLKTTQKFMYNTWVVWIIGTLIECIVFMFATVSYSSALLEDVILYLIANAFIQFIIFILEKGQLKNSKEI